MSGWRRGVGRERRWKGSAPGGDGIFRGARQRLLWDRASTRPIERSLRQHRASAYLIRSIKLRGCPHFIAPALYNLFTFSSNAADHPTRQLAHTQFTMSWRAAMARY